MGWHTHTTDIEIDERQWRELDQTLAPIGTIRQDSINSNDKKTVITYVIEDPEGTCGLTDDSNYAVVIDRSPGLPDYSKESLPRQKVNCRVEVGSSNKRFNAWILDRTKATCGVAA